MEGPDPTKSVLPKVPIPVEESRAQRLQRSQARFRDRGGIFVPSARNTLGDILLGRKVASPKKRRGRSASLSPKKKSVKSDARGGDDQVKTVRTSPRKAMQRNEPEAGLTENHTQSATYKSKATKKPTKEASTPVIATPKVNKDSEKPATKKRGRKPKTTVQDADTITDHDPPPLAKSQSTTKKAVTKRVSKKASRPEKDPSAENASSPKSKRPAKAAKPLPDGVLAEDDVDVKKSSRTSTSKKSTASKRKTVTSVDHGSEPVPLQQSSKSANSTKSKKTSASEGDRRTNEVHQESLKETAIAKGKRKGKAPQSTDSGENPGVTTLEAPPNPRKKRARPADSEVECPSSPKRVKQTPSEEAKPTAPRRKAPAAKKENKGTIPQSQDTLSSLPLSTKRVREPDDERTGTKRKKTRGVGDADLISEGPISEQVVDYKGEIKKSQKPEKAKKTPTSKTSRAKKGTAKTSSHANKSSMATKTEPGVVFVTRIRPRKSVMMRLKQLEPHQIDDDPDPINFLC